MIVRSYDLEFMVETSPYVSLYQKKSVYTFSLCMKVSTPHLASKAQNVVRPNSHQVCILGQYTFTKKDFETYLKTTLFLVNSSPPSQISCNNLIKKALG